MRRLLPLLFTCALPASPAATGPLAVPQAPGGCPFSGLQQVDVGFGLTTLNLSLDPAACDLLVQVGFSGGGHVLALGTGVDPVGVRLGAPFGPSGVIYLSSIAHVFPASVGAASTLPLPADPALIGVPLPLQGVAYGWDWWTSTAFWATTQAVVITLQ